MRAAVQDVFARRLALLGRKPGARIAVHMAVAGEAAAFRAVEAFSAPASGIFARSGSAQT